MCRQQIQLHVKASPDLPSRRIPTTIPPDAPLSPRARLNCQINCQTRTCSNTKRVRVTKLYPKKGSNFSDLGASLFILWSEVKQQQITKVFRSGARTGWKQNCSTGPNRYWSKPRVPNRKVAFENRATNCLGAVNGRDSRTAKSKFTVASACKFPKPTLLRKI